MQRPRCFSKLSAKAPRACGPRVPPINWLKPCFRRPGRATDASASCGSLRLAFGLKIDAELLALFIEVAALEAQRARGVGHVVMMSAQFGEQHLALERFQALRQSPASR